jgi:hypothetical protein
LAASEHLQRLVNGDLLSVVQQGRFRYYRIASPEVMTRTVYYPSSPLC